MIIYTRIYECVVLHKLLANEQYRFISSLSANNASYTLIHEVLSAMNIKHTVGGIFCDLSKAFDCVNHRILLKKLERYGIRGTFGALIKSYLTERYQRVALKDKANTVNCSNWELLKHEIPLGSIMGPLFFLLYINDLPTITSKNAKLMLYVDDASLIITNPSPIAFANKLNIVLANELFRENLLFPNFNKTTYLQFRTRTVKNLI